MSADGHGRELPPENLGEMLTAIAHRDTERLAIEVYQTLNEHSPRHVPPPKNVSNPAAIERWRRGGELPDTLLNEFAVWLSHTKNRSTVIEENVRRLRATTWAQMRLRNVGDYWDVLAEWHRDQWGIDEVCEDSADRELQVQAVARNGARR